MGAIRQRVQLFHRRITPVNDDGDNVPNLIPFSSPLVATDGRVARQRRPLDQRTVRMSP